MTASASLALKLVLTPLLIGAASLAGRRWGAAVGGWVVGLPFTSGPVAFFLALDHGTRFATGAASGIMAGAASQAAFCLAYAWTAQKAGWGASFAAATVAFALATVVLKPIVLPEWWSFAAVVAVLAVALTLMPRRVAVLSEQIRRPRWDIPARMLVATAFVVVLTALAPVLGARLAGLLAPFPLFAAVLATFAHRTEGPASAAGVLRGLLLGLFSFAAFFLALALLLVPRGIAFAFAAAIAVALVVQGASLYAGRGLRIA